MDREELIRRNELATSKEWQEIKQLFVEKIIDLARGTTNPERIQGMLSLLYEPNVWISNYESELKKAHTERN